MYDLDERLKKLADEVDENAPLSRVALLLSLKGNSLSQSSPSLVNFNFVCGRLDVFLRITGKREDGYYDLAMTLFSISLLEFHSIEIREIDHDCHCWGHLVSFPRSAAYSCFLGNKFQRHN